MYQPYIRISNGTFSGTLDTVAKNPLGCIYSPPPSQGLLSTSKGFGARPVVKYVQYQSTTNPTPVAAPAPVYWTDETFTIVTGNAAESYSNGTGATGVAIAGYLLPNTTAIAGLTATQLNSSFCFIQIAGFLANAWAPTTSTNPGVGSLIVGSASGNWASTVINTATPLRVLGIQEAAIASSMCDVLVGGLTTFWGS